MIDNFVMCLGILFGFVIMFNFKEFGYVIVEYFLLFRKWIEIIDFLVLFWVFCSICWICYMLFKDKIFNIIII